MSVLFLECEVTEYYAKPPKENQNVNFCFQEKAVLINLMDENDRQAKILTDYYNQKLNKNG